MTIQDQLDALRRKVEEATVGCSGIISVAREVLEPCGLRSNGCNLSACPSGGTGHIPDPRLVPLREATRCPVCPQAVLDAGERLILYEDGVWGCRSCGSTGTRDVRDWPEWAVKGLILGPALTSMVLGADEVIRHFAFEDAATCIAAVSKEVDTMMEVKP